MTAAARMAAFAALLDVEMRNRYVNVALQHALDERGLKGRDRALCTELVYGTVQRQRSLDTLLQPLVQRSVSDLDPPVLTILRMTVYQLTYLTKVPSYAAVHDAVELAKAHARRAAGFVNGVLRAFMRQPGAPLDRLREAASEGGAWADRMGILHSYPTWLLERWAGTFGRESAERLAVACNQAASFSARVNRLKAAPDTVFAGLEQAYGDIAEPSRIWPDGIRFHRGVEISRWPALQTGEVAVQDEGAMLASPLLAPPKAGRVLDMCAGLGTKTIHIAEQMGDVGEVIACDIHAHKLQHLRQAAERMGVTCIRPLLADARSLPDRPGFAGQFDAVLLDAPCSGLGVLRHRPDIRWRRTPEDVASLADLQRQLLRAAARLVKPGGVVLYATCTLLPEENEDVVQSVLDDGDAHLEWAGVHLPSLPPPLRDGARMGRLLIRPDEFGTDGFFYARLMKKNP